MRFPFLCVCAIRGFHLLLCFVGGFSLFAGETVGKRGDLSVGDCCSEGVCFRPSQPDFCRPREAFSCRGFVQLDGCVGGGDGTAFFS